MRTKARLQSKLTIRKSRCVFALASRCTRQRCSIWRRRSTSGRAASPNALLPESEGERRAGRLQSTRVLCPGCKQIKHTRDPGAHACLHVAKRVTAVVTHSGAEEFRSIDEADFRKGNEIEPTGRAADSHISLSDRELQVRIQILEVQGSRCPRLS